MSVATTNWAAPEASAPDAAPPAAGRRRAPRHLLLGLALMVGLSLVFAALALRADPATSVLAVARPVPAGATITEADLRVVRIVPDPGLQVFTEADRRGVVGQTAAVPLVAGSILSPQHIGAPDWPPAGESVIAVGLASGRVPAGLVPGSLVTVMVLSTPDEQSAEPAATAGGQVSASASVVEVAAPDVSGQVVVSLLLNATDARLVAAAGGDVSLVLESPQ